LENLAEISQGLLGSLPKGVAAQAIGGDAGRFESLPNAAGTGRDYFVTYDRNLPPVKVPRVQAHEIAHGVDELAGQIDTSGLKGELQTVYHHLNNPNPHRRSDPRLYVRSELYENGCAEHGRRYQRCSEFVPAN
jgi:hypothetical protein